MKIISPTTLGIFGTVGAWEASAAVEWRPVRGARQEEGGGNLHVRMFSAVWTLLPSGVGWVDLIDGGNFHLALVRRSVAS
jgi:hypothetical protein